MELKKYSPVVLLLSGFLLASCATADIGGNDNGFSIGVENNTPHTLLLEACSGTCKPFADTWVLTSGQVATTEQDPDGVFRPMEVLSRSNQILGCLPFQFNQTAPSGTLVEISSMIPCGKSLGAAQSGGRDWPLIK